MRGDREGPPGRQPDDRNRGSAGFGAAKYAGLGLQFAVSILAFLYAGQWVDRKLETSPLFLIIGVFVGAAASFYAIYRSLMARPRQPNERDP
jgi:ATP synthase protein I